MQAVVSQNERFDFQESSKPSVLDGESLLKVSNVRKTSCNDFSERCSTFAKLLIRIFI